MRIVIAGIVLVCTFMLGVWSGLKFSDRAQETSTEAVSLGPQNSPITPVGGDAISASFSASLDQRDWEALVAQIETARFDGQEELHGRMRTRILSVAREYADQEAAATGIDLLATYIDLNPHDHEALFVLADLQRRGGLLPDALESVFQILDFPVTVEVASEAEALRDELIEEHVALLAAAAPVQRGDFFASLVDREPTNDRHRLALASTHVERGDYAGAEQVLAEIAGFGVAAEEVAALRQQLDFGLAGVPIERVNDSLYASVEVNGARLRLLVDTGATKTVIVPTVLRDLQARPLDRVAQLLTAGGPVRAPLYSIDTVRFGGLELNEFEVVALDSVPRQTDGLLGMDLLAQVGNIDITPNP